MKTPRKFRPYAPDQLLLLPPDMRDWLPGDHLVYFVRDVVRELDLSTITSSYEGALGAGSRPITRR